MVRQMAIAVGIGMAVLVVQPAYADAEWGLLKSEFDQSHAEWQGAMEKLKGDDGAVTFNPAAMPTHPIKKFGDRFRQYAEKHEGKPAALPALTHMLGGGFPMMGGTDQSAVWALTQLKDHHANDPRIGDHLADMGMAVMSAGEDPVIAFLEAVAEKNPDREIAGGAQLAIAEILYEESPFAMMMGSGNAEETKAKRERAAKILRSIKSEFAETALAKQADDSLFVIDHLQVGMRAPEIVGKDAGGREIRLSQFHGKVVAIIFWGTWCAPCMQMIPHERELMEKYTDKPFTILGINANDTLTDLKKALRKDRITWPTIFDGEPGESKITKKWRVRSFPMIYMIDHKGVIRRNMVMPFQLDQVVGELVASALEDDKND